MGLLSEKFENARKYVLANEEILKRAYGNNYIAVKEDVVVGNNKDEFDLARELEYKFRHEAVLVGTIDSIIHSREDHLESPESEAR